MASLPPRRSGQGAADYSDFRAIPPRRSNNALWIVLIVAAVCLVMMCTVGGILAALIFPAIQQARGAVKREEVRNDLMVIGLSAHNFHDQFAYFPPAAADGSDPKITEPISFHTALLPFIDQPALDRAVDRTIPWDRAENRTSYATVIDLFLSPEFEEAMNVEGYAVTHYVPNTQVIQNGKGMRIQDVTDGTSNTILAGQVNAGFPAWGDPNNGRDPANGFAGGANAFGGMSSDGALMLMMDGSVRTMGPRMNPTAAAALASPNGGETTPPPAY